MPPSASIVVDSRFQGIPQVALGGYVGGLLAGTTAAAEAVFRRPVPVGRPLGVEALGAEERGVFDGQELLARVRAVEVDVAVPPAVGLGESEVARLAYPGLGRHLFPNCFTCGPQRAEADGLRIFTGPVPGRDVVASPWTPDGSLAQGTDGIAREYIWSALDCPSIWALVAREPLDSRERFVSARMAVQQRAPVMPLRPYVVMAWEIGRDERSRTGGASILSASGEVCAVARHTLLRADWGVPLSLAEWR